MDDSQSLVHSISVDPTSEVADISNVSESSANECLVERVIVAAGKCNLDIQNTQSSTEISNQL